MGEKGAAGGEAIEARGGDVGSGVRVGGDIGVAVIIADNEKDVRLGEGTFFGTDTVEGFVGWWCVVGEFEGSFRFQRCDGIRNGIRLALREG